MPVLLALAASSAACGAAEGAADDEVVSDEAAIAGEHTEALTVTVDPRKSILITDFDIVDTFSLKEVLDQLSDGHALDMFRQLFATQLPAGAEGAGSGPNCTGTLNGWPEECPRLEGQEATRDPFADPTSGESYKAITLSNRFDLAPADGANCGEYRVNFARRSGNTNRGSLERVFIAFEARLPNPKPSLGLAGCLPVVQFWRGLSSVAPAVRAARLRDFYFKGLPGFLPVIHKNLFGAVPGPQGGQIRLNEFLFIQTVSGDWSMREYRLVPQPSGQSPSALLLPTFDDDTPARSLFNPVPADARAVRFQQEYFPNQVERLALQDINTMNYVAPVPDDLNTGDSHLTGNMTEFFSDYAPEFGPGPSPFRTLIQQKLTAIGSTLTPENIVERATTLGCGGCHHFSQGKTTLGFPTPFPVSLGFNQVGEDLIAIPGEPGRERYQTSALLESALGYRAQIMRDFLAPVRGFERDAGWTSSQAQLALNTSIKTEGTSSLRVIPVGGWSELVSIPSSTIGAGSIGSTLKLDIRLPPQQPNPYFRGQVGVLISIPSASINDQYLGPVSLDSAALGQFSTVTIPLPAKVQRILRYGVADVRLKIQLNVPPNSNPYYLDNIRF
ncbi:MAG: hypothetical protein EOO73_33345 [Myxococcales bacterium]|nr:MAG: hypothetical protein EOO73_33345 [Myxococcales bacterium]